MHPILFQLGPITIHTYGFLISMGFLAALAVAKRLARRDHINPDQILDLSFWSLLIGFIGARVLFIITRFSDYLQHPLDMFKIWEGGLVFLGGPIAVIPFITFYVRKHKIPLWKALDVLTPPLVVGHFFGRFGCLAAGCCYGKPTGTYFGIKFYSPLVDTRLWGIPLHPTQLYEAAALFILLCGLLYVFKHKRFDGQVAFTYLLAYPPIRSIVEVFRGDLIRGFVIDDILSTSQFLSILIFFGAAALLWYKWNSLAPGKSPSHKLTNKVKKSTGNRALAGNK